MTKRYLIIGATSAIALATARIIASRGEQLLLLARDADQLDVIARDLRSRGACSVDTERFDALDLHATADIINAVFERAERIDAVLIAHGTLGDQACCEESIDETLALIQTNALSSIAVLTVLANRMERQGFGTIAVITSIAGDLGRKGNYVYGAAKGMVSIFLQGLRNRLHGRGVQVLDIKPGLVDTPMTRRLRKGFLWSTPEKVAGYIVKGIDHNRSLVYAPYYWRWVSFVLRHLPNALAKRLDL